MNQRLADKINQMAARDQKMRKDAHQSGKWDEKIDRNNTAALKEIVAQYGWPTEELVGSEASHNAWLLAQHADHDHEFQKQVLGMLTQKREIAYLTDRILVAEGKEQEFGTQFQSDGKGGWELYPIRDQAKINARRNEYELETLEEYLETFFSAHN